MAKKVDWIDDVNVKVDNGCSAVANVETAEKPNVETHED